MSAAHRSPLGGTGWSVWHDALLRSPGFPASGLDALAAPGLGELADRLLDRCDADVCADKGCREEFLAAFGEAVTAISATLSGIAADPMLREAVTWQNPGVLSTLDALAREPAPAVRRARRREREKALVRYWQRYCGKNETVGFFGPVCWVRVDPGLPQAVSVRPGPGLLRRRRVFLEHWALAAYGERLGADPAIRPWLAPELPPHVTLEGRLVRLPSRAPITLTPSDAAILAACDGSRPAREVAAAALADPALGLRTTEDVYLLLDRLVERGVLVWGVQVPVSRLAEDDLERRVAAIGDPEARLRAKAGLDRLRAACAAAGHAAGDPDRLRAALTALDAEVAALTGQPPRRRDGQAYAGRTPCYEDTTRDLDVVFGGPFVATLAEPLALVAQTARWLTTALADVYGAALRELYDELAAQDREVRLGDLWYLAQGLFWGKGKRPLDTVTEQFARRWSKLFDLDALPEGTREAHWEPAELADRVAALFPARAPGWSAGFVHSPDLQICAVDEAAINRGDYLVVLGELHAARSTLDCAIFTMWHPDQAALWEAIAADVGGGRLRPLYPVDWPRNSGRIPLSDGDPGDVRLGFTPAPRPVDGAVLPAPAVLLREIDGEVLACAPDGRRWPLVEVFSALLSIHAVDAFKRLGARQHSPRISVGRLVVARQTWRTTVGETGLTWVRDEADQYLGVRRWRRRLGLPDRVFVGIGTETKPVYADLTSPQSSAALCTMLRSTRLAHGDDVAVTVTEMLPTPDAAWVPDGAGRRYFSELRLQLTDPVADR